MRLRRLFAALPALWALFAAPAVLAADDEYLPQEQAFQYTVTADESNIHVEWRAAQGYYLYKKRMGVASATPGIQLGETVFPTGEVHKDEYFGEQEVFRNTFTVTAPLTNAKAGDAVVVKLKWQGCADAGLCYPPTDAVETVKVLGIAAAAPEVAADDDFLPVDKAFELTGDALSVNNLQLNWRIADGYYLYKGRIKIEPAGNTKTIGALILPKGENHHDEYFGDQEVYRKSLDATFSVPPSDAKTVDVKVTYQGCADAGLCYPPEIKTMSISVENAPPATAVPTASADDGGGYVSEQDSILAKIATGSLFVVVLVAFLGGLGMSFTPCVLPMVPILTGIIAGGGDKTTPARGFMLSLMYVIGIAIVYVGMGVLAAYFGNQVNLNAIFNQPIILVPFALLFVFLATSMFGAFTIEMPSFIQSRLSDASNNQRAGTFVGVAVMGALSALIVSACVAPVLIAVLSFIAKTGDLKRGAVAMLSLSLGMGTPLMLVGASAGALLPRAGAWMETVKNLFGVMFLAVAAWLLSRIVPGWAVMLLWSATAASLAWVLLRAKFRSQGANKASKGLGGAAAVYSLTLIVGIFLGSTNPLAPIPQLADKVTPLEFKRFKTVADLEREVAAASAAGKPVMVDFFATWCFSCLEMEHKTFTQPEVQAELKNAVLLQADVSANDDEDKALYAYFDINGPPTIALYGTDGKERKKYRVVGFMKAREFASVIKQAFAAAP